MANYKFSNRVRNFSGILMILGIIGLAYGFLSAPSNLEEAQAMISDSHHGEGHSEKVANQGDNSGASYHNEKESLSERLTSKTLTFRATCCCLLSKFLR